MSKTLSEEIHDDLWGYRVTLKSPRGAVRNVVVNAPSVSTARGYANETIGWRWDVVKVVRLIDEM